MSITTSNNKYDVYIFVIIISTVYRHWGILHPTTFLSLYFLPLLIKNSDTFNSRYLKPFVSFFIFWLFYAFVSFSWTPNMSDGFLDMFLLFIHVLLFLEIIVFSLKANNPLKTISNAWIYAFLITSVIALWEISSGNHLAFARVESDAFIDSRGNTYATVTFFNPNTYCYFMCLTFPFLLYKLSQSKGWGMLSIGIILLLIFIMSRNSSRGGLITLLLMISVYVYYKMKRSSIRKKLYIFFLIFLFLLFLIAFGDVLFSTILNRLESKGLLESNVRLLLIICSWQLFLDSYGFGRGVGSMLYELENTSLNFSDIYYAHNMLLEILLEYGLIITLGLIFFLYKLFIRAKSNDNYYIKSIIMGVLISFPFYSVINSANLRPHFIWIFFATIYVLSISNIVNKKNYESLICD